MNKKKSGFGMIEILIIVVIIGVIVMVMLKKEKNNDGQTKKKPMAALQEAKAVHSTANRAILRQAVVRYQAEHAGELPGSLDQLVKERYCTSSDIIDSRGNKVPYNPQTGKVGSGE